MVQGHLKQVENNQIKDKWQTPDGLLYYKWRLVLPGKSELLATILEQLHGSTHEGFEKTLYRVKRSFYWPKMEADIKQFVRECDVYQRDKLQNMSSAGLPKLDISFTHTRTSLG